MSLSLAASEAGISRDGEEVGIAAVFLQSLHPLDYVHQTSHAHLSPVRERREVKKGGRGERSGNRKEGEERGLVIFDTRHKQQVFEGIESIVLSTQVQ